MLVPLKWINDYVDLGEMDGQSYGDMMTMVGLTLESARHFGAETENVVVGKILEIERHPDADKLVVCKVDVGKDEALQIVTGAANLFIGAIVPVALHNSRVPGPLHGKEKEEGGTKISKGKLRGVLSEGMLCGAQELGWDDKVAPYMSKDGIWILQLGDDAVGKNVVEALEMDTDTVDLDVTPNRPDWLSMIAVAKDSAAALGRHAVIQKSECKCLGSGKVSDYISVEVRNKNCRRYTARIITDVKIEQSPWWLQERLMLAGQRPINNIVDITNFVMLEYGQPLHAFDIETVEDRKIIVDTAKEGESFTTLDGKERRLFSDTLMINDGKKPIGIAGIMGGLNSEIEADTKTVILEAANFDRDSIRISAKKLELKTEAASRYIRGIDPNLCSAAADRFCSLVEELGAGKVVAGSVDIYPEPEKPLSCKVRLSRINKLIGAEIPKEEVLRYFELLDFDCENTEDEDVLLVTAPTVRRDMKIEADYAEEVARLYGYDKIPSTLPETALKSEVSESWKLRALCRDTLCGMGLNEIQTYSFVSARGVDRLKLAEDTWERDFVRILNPLGEETSVMRTLLLPNMLETLARNNSRNLPEAKAFEIGNTFMPNMVDPAAGKPEEQLSLCMGVYGAGEDFFSLKGRVEKLLERIGIEGAEYAEESEYAAFHPGRCARVQLGELELGILGQIHPDVAAAFELDKAVYACELNFDLLLSQAKPEKHYKPLPKYPAVPRDIALVVDEEVKVGDIEKLIRENGGELLENVELFDVYRGIPIPPGKKSCAFSLRYRAADRTLKDEEVEELNERILLTLREKLNAVLRDM